MLICAEGGIQNERYVRALLEQKQLEPSLCSAILNSFSGNGTPEALTDGALADACDELLERCAKFELVLYSLALRVAIERGAVPSLRDTVHQ